MRTTIKIDDELLRAAKSIAATEHKTIGEVISALLRKALLLKDYSEGDEGIPSFRVSENAPPLTPEMVSEAEEDASK
jgi:negative regulator of replication initiation